MKKLILLSIILCFSTFNIYSSNNEENISKIQINVINLMVLGDFNLSYERVSNNSLSTIGIIHYIPDSEQEKQTNYRYPSLSINYGLRSYITTNFFELITPNLSSQKGFGAYIELLAGINKNGDSYFGSGIFWLGISHPVNKSLFIDYGLGLTRYLGDSKLYDNLSNEKDVIPGAKFSLGIKL